MATQPTAQLLPRSTPRRCGFRAACAAECRGAGERACISIRKRAVRLAFARSWAKVRQVMFAWWVWAIAAIIALVYDNWGWAIGTGLMAAFAFLVWPREVPPRVGLEHEFCVDDDEFLTTMAGSTGVPFFEGNAIEILNNGDEFYPAMLKAIAQAQCSITVEAYIYWAGDIGKRFAEALADARQGRRRREDSARRRRLVDDRRRDPRDSREGRMPARVVQPGAPVQHRPLQSPHPPQVADRRRTHRVHRRRRHRRSLDGKRAGQRALARHSDPDGRARRRAAANRVRAELAAGDWRSDYRIRVLPRRSRSRPGSLRCRRS